MTPSGQTICLCMIVKNEAHVIQRCLESVRPIIDHWIIVDTGSTDGTQHIIRTVMADVSGEVIERPWRDFASNRSESLALARPHGDYSLIIDADDELVLASDFRMPDLRADSYSVDIAYGASRYRRPQLVRNALPWHYRGVLHEFLECADATTSDHLPIEMKINHEGRRSTDPDTYRRDAAILEQALARETDPFLIARYTFYLAQSYRDSGQVDAALTTYLHRATLGFWIEEVYFSYLQAGRLMETLGREPDEIIATYARATQCYPLRVEADHAASRLCRLRLRYQQGYEIAKAAIDRPFPDGALFVEPWVYHYGLLDEYSVNAYWAGHYRDSLDGALRAMASPHLPAADLPRFVANARFAFDRLPRLDQRGASTEAPPASRNTVSTMTLPLSINLGSGKDFRADCLNIDVDPSWHPDVVLDLAAQKLSPAGIGISTERFGDVMLMPGRFDAIIANDVLEHVPDLVALMTTCLGLLRTGGVFRISVPYDLSFGAWQDPTHVRTFNERSWLYYTDWFWYLGWSDARFAIETMEFVTSADGDALRARGVPDEEIHRTPRAVDSLSVTLRKVELTADDLRASDKWRKRRDQSVSMVTDALSPVAAAFTGSWNDNRDQFCIWVVRPPGYAHHQALDDAAETLSAAFAALGGSAPLVTNSSNLGGRRPIIFGGHLLSTDDRVGLPSDSIIFNLEQVTHDTAWMTDNYLDLLRRHPVLDYSLTNTQALHAAGIGHAQHFPIRAMPQASPDIAIEQDIDVLFYGSINDRRAQIIEALRARHLNVVHLFGVYGEERRTAIARAKIILNVHYYASGIFEAVRVSQLLAAGKCVVSEGREDDPDCADLIDALVLCRFDQIVDACSALIADDANRKAIECRARDISSGNPQSAILAAAFAKE